MLSNIPMAVNLRVSPGCTSLPYSLGKSVGRWPSTTSAPANLPREGHGNSRCFS